MSDEKLKDRRLSELFQSLLKRNYPESLIKQSIASAKKIPRENLLNVNLKSEEDILPYISTHSLRNPEVYSIINQHLPLLYADPKMKEILKTTTFIKSKRQLPNLKRLLTKANFSSITSSHKENRVLNVTDQTAVYVSIF